VFRQANSLRGGDHAERRGRDRYLSLLPWRRRGPIRPDRGTVAMRSMRWKRRDRRSRAARPLRVLPGDGDRPYLPLSRVRWRRGARLRSDPGATLHGLSRPGHGPHEWLALPVLPRPWTDSRRGRCATAFPAANASPRRRGIHSFRALHTGAALRTRAGRRSGDGRTPANPTCLSRSFPARQQLHRRSRMENTPGRV
jgi:hypothetical protein